MKRFIGLIIVILFINVSKAQSGAYDEKLIWTIRTNLLYDIAVTPNIGVEFAVNDSWSIGTNWIYAWWGDRDRNRYWRIYGGDFFVNHYLFRDENSAPLTGHHVGGFFQAGTYDFEFGGDGQKAEFNWGLSISYGYSLAIARRLNLDFELGVGFVAGNYQKYYPDNGCYVWEDTKHRNYLGITKLGVTLAWFIDK
ncbi:MAG: DUF3575 domain-containing protein [Bacteroidales bacterium]